MQELDVEISRISRLLPNVEVSIIENFMISVPKTIEYLRVPLTLVHFFKLDDHQNTEKLQHENNEYANLIHDLFPMYSVNKTVKKLTKYGNIAERCRLVVRNILKSREQEFDIALNRVSQSVFYIQFGKQGHSSEHNNDNYEEMCNLADTVRKENEDFSADTQGYISSEECHESVCDYTTSVFNDRLGSEDCFETVITPSISSEVIIENSKNQRTELNKSPLVWNQEDFDEKQYSVGSSYRQQQEETYSYDSNPTCSGGYSDHFELELNDPIKQSDINCERDHNETIKNNSICTSPVTLGTLFDQSSLVTLGTSFDYPSNNFDVSLQPTVIRNIIKFEESVKDSSGTKYSSRKLSNDSYPESLDCDPPRKKMKKSLSKKKENEVAIEDVYLDKDVFENDFKPNKMKKIISSNKENNRVIYRMMEIFPDADPDFIRQMYAEMPGEASSEEVLHNNLIEKILSVENYPKRPPRELSTEVNFDFESQLQTIAELLPQADPSYLRMKVSELPPEELMSFVNEALEKQNYPTLKEYLRKQQLSAQKRQYTVDFSVDDFVKLVPNPNETFQDPNRKVKIYGEDKNYVFQFFKNKFNRIKVKNIQSIGSNCDFRPIDCYNSLVKLKETMKYCRSKVDMSSLTCSNIPLLQELAFIDHRDEILSYIGDLEKKKEIERMRIKKEGRMLTCSCCFDDEVMPDYAHRCSNNCVFCKGCIIKSVEVAFGEGKLVFPCIGNCGSHFGLQNLQDVLPPNLFSKIAQKHAVAEVKAAGIEDLEFCPFCDFATILSGGPETNKIFVCQNPECLKESCRLCKEPSHVPLHCDEVEKDDEVKNRVYIENKMTEALLRKCFKCGVSFYKEEGCNKMTCSCGATMCYICGQAVTDYKHFNGLGGDKYDLCPLYSDTIAINHQNVIKGAEAAKKELEVAGGAQLLHDPTSDVQKHFEDRAKQLPVEPHMEHLRLLNQMAQVIDIRDHNAAPLPGIPFNHRRQNHRPRRQQPQHQFDPTCLCAHCVPRRY